MQHDFFFFAVTHDHEKRSKFKFYGGCKLKQRFWTSGEDHKDCNSRKNRLCIWQIKQSGSEAIKFETARPELTF